MAKVTKLKPGTFVYGSAMVFEIDANGKKHPRPDLGPNSKGAWKLKFTKGLKK
jgi:hypothetical protein